MKSKFDTAKDVLRRHGIKGLLLYATRILLYRRKDSDRIFLYILKTPRPTQASIDAVKDHVFRFATVEDLMPLLEEPKWDIQEKHIDALRRGDKCLLQLDGDNLVGYTWVITSPLIEIAWGFHFNMPDDTVYNYKGFTSPEYRGKNFQPLRHLKILEFVRDQGKTKLFGYVDHLNMNSQKGVTKSGYKKIGVLRCKRNGNDIQFSFKVKGGAWSMERRN